MRLKKIIIALMTALTFYGTMNVAASTEIAEAKTTKVYKSNLSKQTKKQRTGSLTTNHGVHIMPVTVDTLAVIN